MNRPFLRQTTAVAILFGVCMAVLLGIVRPIITSFVSNRASMSDLRQRLADVAARRPDPASINNRRRTIDAIPEQVSGLLKVTSEGEATGKLESYLRTTFQSKRARLQLMRVTGPARDDLGVRTIRASIGGQVPQDQALELVIALETGSPAIFFESVRLRRLDRRRNDQDASQVELTGTIRAYLDLPEAIEGTR